MCAVAVAGTVGVLPWSEPAAVLLAAGLVVGGSIAPDLDHGRASPSRSFGPVTRVLSAVIQAASAATYAATRSASDPAGARAHRTLTHSAMGCLLAGLGLALLMQADTAWGPVPGAVTVGLITGLGVHALLGRPTWKRRDDTPILPSRRRRRRRSRPLLSRDAWKWLAAVAAGGLVMAHPQLATGWWPWWLGASLALGMAVHCAGDAMTVQGVPWAWPLVRDGRRWRQAWLLPAPLRFVTQHTGERVAVAVITAATVGLVAAVLSVDLWWTPERAARLEVAVSAPPGWLLVVGGVAVAWLVLALAVRGVRWWRRRPASTVRAERARRAALVVRGGAS